MTRALHGLAIQPDVALARHTTLGLGGSAERLVVVRSESELLAAVDLAAERGWPLAILGGGSNVVVADRGVPGLVVLMQLGGLAVDGDRIVAAAGESWGRVVDTAVAHGLAGIECLAGIPGSAGATPIQNVGAYGQEVGETIELVRALELSTGRWIELDPEALELGYRSSRLKREPGRWIVGAVTYRLGSSQPAAPRYAELARSLPPDADLATVRDTVLGLRRAKSMVIEADDPNRHSVGSFFTNPVVPAGRSQWVIERILASGTVAAEADIPRWDVTGGCKLSAGWLIERAGFPRGSRRGSIGQSSRHALALVHHGGGSSAELLVYAAEIRQAVGERFGVALEVEPVLLGFEVGDPLVSALTGPIGG